MRALPAAERCGCGTAASLDSPQGLDERESVLYAARLCWYFQCGVLPRFTPAVCRMATNRTACGSLRFYSAGSRSPLCILAVSVQLSAFVGSLRVWPFLYGDLDGVPGTRRTGLAARRLCVFAQAHWLCGVFRGEYAGAKCGSRTAAAPDCAKESSTLWTLFRGWPSGRVCFTRRGCVGVDSLRRHPGTRKDPPGSNLWPGGSCCIEMLSVRSIVQTRAAPKRRGVGLQRAERSACRLSLLSP